MPDSHPPTSDRSDEHRARRRASPPQPWPRIKSEHGDHLLIFRPRFDTLRHPRTNQVFQRVVLETPDWVNVVALTKERELVVVHQYRFGSRAVTIEIPGGMVDAGEEHGQAARRELREETGYTAPRWTYLGSVEPNPAFHTNLCHHWLAEDASLTHEQGLDMGEDIVIETIPIDEIGAMVARGEIRHSLVITALARVLDLRGQRV